MNDILCTRLHRASPGATSSQARAFFTQTRSQARRPFSSSSRRSIPPVPLASPESQSAQAYCSQLLRQYDSPSFTLSHFIPQHARPAYLAIRAFNIEVSRIPDIVSNTTIGQMRHQFWRDAINKTFDGNPPNEPVAVLLASYMHDTNIRLNKTWFQRIINTREAALTRPGFVNLSALESYAEATYSTLLYLTLSGLPLNSLTADHVASHIGKAAGISAVLRGVPLLAFPPPPNTHSVNPAGIGLSPSRDRQRVVNLPLDVMSQCGVQEQDVYKNGGEATGLRDAVFTVATRASDHLITARSLFEQVKKFEEVSHEFEHVGEEGYEYSKYQMGERQSREARKKDAEGAYGTVMGPAISTQLWLDRLQKVDFDIFHSSLRTTEWKLPGIAWWRNRQGVF